MRISPDTIATIAQLSRLEFSKEEQATFVEQFENILEYFHAIDLLDLEHVEPLKSILDIGENTFREDEAYRAITTEEALLNAPKHNGVFFKVPKVLG
ncbi:MAG: Asp-tRNA(Asn)/Glu-tRNA(Gln) amidotransferase subunit GatC [Bacteroidota bacterium]|nr:Asp-tRNA(Asn)/Glu-tRNA(Gln) amidotransferase subunit GatC [Candidatus Kapabacteria bacterium]MDW8221067.1 Asp-tRNA(Asn)/Glu-tRNA(Gln) amidotransferase subunit GatC [Bacteroidota bacterium]